MGWRGSGARGFFFGSRDGAAADDARRSFLEFFSVTSVKASAMVSTRVVACCDAQYATRRAAHARAAADSPPGCAIFCIATGAAMSGAARRGRPSSGNEAEVSTSDTSTRHLGHSVTSANAAELARMVVSDSAPPAK